MRYACYNLQFYSSPAASMRMQNMFTGHWYFFVCNAISAGCANWRTDLHKHSSWQEYRNDFTRSLSRVFVYMSSVQVYTGWTCNLHLLINCMLLQEIRVIKCYCQSEELSLTMQAQTHFFLQKAFSLVLTCDAEGYLFVLFAAKLWTESKNEFENEFVWVSW